MKFPAVVLATKQETPMSSTTTAVMPFVVVAASEAEALGKAWQCAYKLLPDSDGWRNRYAKVGRPDELGVIDNVNEAKTYPAQS